MSGSSKDSMWLGCKPHQVTQLKILSQFSTRSQHGKMYKVVFPGTSPFQIAHMLVPLVLNVLWQPSSYLGEVHHRCWVLFNFELIELFAARVLYGVFLNS